jgi:hypothetical protein
LVLKRVLGTFLASIGAQAAFVYFLRALVDAGFGDRSCDNEGSPYLRGLYLVVLNMLTLSNVVETNDMARWLRMVPEWNEEKHAALQKEHNTFLCVRSCETFAKEGERVIEAGHVFATGITPCSRALVYACVLVPKVALALAIMVYASAYIVYAPTNEDLILNSVATVFVLDVDDYAYKYLVPSVFQAAVESFPTIMTRGEGGESKIDTFLYQLFGPCFLPLVLAGATAATYEGWWCRRAGERPRRHGGGVGRVRGPCGRDLIVLSWLLEECCARMNS